MKHVQVYAITCLFLFATLALAACSSSTSAQNPLPTNTASNVPAVAPTATLQATPVISILGIQVDETDAGKNIQLSVGDILSITLTSNPSTGYTWETETIADPLLEQIGDGTYQSSSNLVGASGKLTLQFKAIKAGTQTLTLDYHRSFEKGVAPAKTYQITVTVVAGQNTGNGTPTASATPS